MTDLLSLWREARGPEPELPRPFVPGDECNPRDFFVADQMHAHYAAAVTEDALAKFAAAIEQRVRAEERERCAVKAEQFLTAGRSPLCRQVAAAIRALT